MLRPFPMASFEVGVVLQESLSTATPPHASAQIKRDFNNEGDTDTQAHRHTRKRLPKWTLKKWPTLICEKHSCWIVPEDNNNLKNWLRLSGTWWHTVSIVSIIYCDRDHQQ